MTTMTKHEINQRTPPIYKSEQAANEVLTRYKELLQLWPVANEQRFVPTREGDTFVVVSGPEDAPALLLLHGTMSNAASWMREVTTWAQVFRVFAVDIIGDAGFSAPSRPSFATGAHALWLADLLDGLGVRSATLIGTSLGGAIALDFAIRQPNRVDALVLVTPGGVADKNIIGWALPLLLLGPWGARKVRERIIGKFPEPESVEERKLAQLTDLIFANMVARAEKLPSPSDEELNGLKMPLLLLLGGRDVTMNASVVRRRFKENVPQAEIVYNPEALHYLGDLSQPIMQFLRRATTAETAG